MGDDDFFAGLVPMAVVVDAGEGADGADDGVGGRDDGLGLFDQEAESVAGLFGSEAEEAEGFGVAVNDAAVGEIEFVSDDGWAVPVKDGLLDGVAFRVVADGTVGDVAEEGAVGLFVAASNPFRRRARPKTPTLCQPRKGWGTLNINCKILTVISRARSATYDSCGRRGSLKIPFRVNFGLRWIRRVRFNGDFCVHLSFLWFFEFGAGLTGWE